MSQGYYSIPITVQSDHATSGTNSNFQIALPTPICNAFAFRVIDVFFPLTYYIWTDTVTIDFTTDVTGVVTVTIPPGSYSSSAIAALIEAAFLAQTTDTVVATFDLSTLVFYLAITPGVNNTLEVSAANLLSTPTGLQYLGFTAPAGPAAQINGNQAFNFNNPLRMYIHSSNLSPYQTFQSDPVLRTFTKSTMIRAIPAYLTTGAYELFDKPTDWYSFSEPKTISTLDFQVRDEYGNIVDLHTYRWSINIELRFSKNS